MKRLPILAIGLLAIISSSLAMMHFENEHPPSISPALPFLPPSAATSSHQPQHIPSDNAPPPLLHSCIRNNGSRPSVNSVVFAKQESNPPVSPQHDDPEYEDQRPLQPSHNNAAHALLQRQYACCACRNNEHMDTTCCLAVCGIIWCISFITTVTIYTYTLLYSQ